MEQAVDTNKIDFIGLKRRELVKQNLIATKNKQQRNNAIEGQNVQRNGLLRNVDENDPLVQLRYKMDNLDQEAKEKLDEKLSWKSRERLKDKMAAESNQRKLLNEGNGILGNKDVLDRLHNPGIKLIRERFAKRNLDKNQMKDEIKEADNDKPNGRAVSRIPVLGEFDMEAYLSAQRMKEGEGDPMKNFKFNQVASDSTPPDRYLKDVRNPRYYGVVVFTN